MGKGERGAGHGNFLIKGFKNRWGFGDGHKTITFYPFNLSTTKLRRNLQALRKSFKKSLCSGKEYRVKAGIVNNAG